MKGIIPKYPTLGVRIALNNLLSYSYINIIIIININGKTASFGS
jgi:hypothetical protein